MKDLPIAAENISLCELRKYARAEREKSQSEIEFRFACTKEQLAKAGALPGFVHEFQFTDNEFTRELRKHGEIYGAVECFSFYKK